MKIIQIVLIISMLFSSAAFADIVTVVDTPAGIYDAVHAKFDVDKHTGDAFVRVFMMDESSHRDCWGNQAAMQGISSDACRVITKRFALPGLAYDANLKTNALFGGEVSQDDLVSEVYYKDVDDGVGLNTVKHIRVTLEKP
jgi:hypothetical protein